MTPGEIALRTLPIASQDLDKQKGGNFLASYFEEHIPYRIKLLATCVHACQLILNDPSESLRKWEIPWKCELLGKTYRVYTNPVIESGIASVRSIVHFLGFTVNQDKIKKNPVTLGPPKFVPYDGSRPGSIDITIKTFGGQVANYLDLRTELPITSSNHTDFDECILKVVFEANKGTLHWTSAVADDVNLRILGKACIASINLVLKKIQTTPQAWRDLWWQLEDKDMNLFLEGIADRFKGEWIIIGPGWRNQQHQPTNTPPNTVTGNRPFII